MLDPADDIEEEFDRVQAMIAWLADKDPDVWFEITRQLNWDTSERVLDWIISQPSCDKANAALIFWGCSPEHYARELATGRKSNAAPFQLMMKILRFWKKGFYTRAALAWRLEDRQAQLYRAAIDSADPFGVPPDLFGPLNGRRPAVPEFARPHDSAEIYDLLYNLGTYVGPRPGSTEWRRQRASRWAALSGDEHANENTAPDFWAKQGRRVGVAVLVSAVIVIAWRLFMHGALF